MVFSMVGNIQISIIIPTFNRKEKLQNTLNSLTNQTYPSSKFEVIICDDVLSKDGTENLIHQMIHKSNLNIKYYKIKAKYPGPAYARNYALKYAIGEFIGFIDDDCIAFSDWIESAMNFFKNHKVDMIQGAVFPKYPEFEWKFAFKMPRGAVHTIDNGFYVTANLFVRKDIMCEVGGFEEAIKWGEDTDLVYRLLSKGYNIMFSENIKVYHEMEYLNIVSYAKYLSNFSYLPLQVKRNPKIRKHLYLKFISNLSHIYPIFFFLSFIFYLSSLDVFFKSMFLLFIFFYLYSRVIVDSKWYKYPLRVVVFPRNLLLDSTKVFYLLKGSLKYHCLVI